MGVLAQLEGVSFDTPAPVSKIRSRERCAGPDARDPSRHRPPRSGLRPPASSAAGEQSKSRNRSASGVLLYERARLIISSVIGGSSVALACRNLILPANRGYYRKRPAATALCEAHVPAGFALPSYTITGEHDHNRIRLTQVVADDGRPSIGQKCK